MRIVIIVQARITSTRLPGKVLKEVLRKSLLEYQIERLRRVSLASDIVIATTTNATDDCIVDLCKKLEVSFFRGSELDVLSRYYEAAKLYKAEVVVRVTSDCPLIDPAVIDKVIEYYCEHYPAHDYVSNSLYRTYPRGMDTEIFSYVALDQAYKNATSQFEKEHVTPFIHMNPQRFILGNVNHVEDQSRHRWTVDTIEDFELIKKIITELYPQNKTFSMDDVLQCLEYNPEWFYINAHVQQKHC